MTEKICPLLSISANHAEDGMQHCRRKKCAWYCAGREMCSLEALAVNTDALGDGIQANLADIADNISDK